MAVRMIKGICMNPAVCTFGLHKAGERNSLKWMFPLDVGTTLMQIIHLHFLTDFFQHEDYASFKNSNLHLIPCNKIMMSIAIIIRDVHH